VGNAVSASFVTPQAAGSWGNDAQGDPFVIRQLGGNGAASAFSVSGGKGRIAAAPPVSGTLRYQTYIGPVTKNQDTTFEASWDVHDPGGWQEVWMWICYSGTGQPGVRLRLIDVTNAGRLNGILEHAEGTTITVIGAQTEIEPIYNLGDSYTLRIMKQEAHVQAAVYPTASSFLDWTWDIPDLSALIDANGDNLDPLLSGGQFCLVVQKNTGSSATTNYAIDNIVAHELPTTFYPNVVPYLGLAHGHLLDDSTQFTVNAQSRFLKAARAAYGPGCVVRTDASPGTNTLVRGNTLSSADIAYFDAAYTRYAQAGVAPLANLHTGRTGLSLRFVPPLDGISGDPTGVGGMQSWYDWLYSYWRRYGIGGSFSTLGWVGILLAELWNEPNTNSGNIPGSPHKLDYASINEIVRAGTLAIRAAAAANGHPAHLIGYALGGIDTPYLMNIVNLAATLGQPNPLGQLDSVSCHVYPGSLPQTGPGGPMPLASSDTLVLGQSGQVNFHNWKTLLTFAEYLATAAPTGQVPKLFISESGFRSNDTTNRYLGNSSPGPFVEWTIPEKVGTAPGGLQQGEFDMETGELAVLDWVNSPSQASLNLSGVLHYGLQRYSGDRYPFRPPGTGPLGAFYDVKGDSSTAALPIQNWAPWVRAVSRRMIAYGLQQAGAPPRSPAGRWHVGTGRRVSVG
jgi:hypothetical protein